MKQNEIALRPAYWASVSGGKDSLYMLNYIMQNLDRYPLDGVVHFELEIDYPFINNVVDWMESACKNAVYVLNVLNLEKHGKNYITNMVFRREPQGGVIAIINLTHESN